MQEEFFTIGHVPAVLYGRAAQGAFLFVHGQSGCKEEAAAFAPFAEAAGWQVLGIDLPEHGARRGEAVSLVPWNVVPELQAVLEWMQSRWPRLALRANSIGAWFCMQAFGEKPLAASMFVSPLLDMRGMIEAMMQLAGVTQQELRQKQEITTASGAVLSWRYYQYAIRHPVACWPTPCAILYAGQDALIPRETVQRFAREFNCRLTIMEDGEHWFHTPPQLAVLNEWTRDELSRLARIEAEN